MPEKIIGIDAAIRKIAKTKKCRLICREGKSFFS